MFNTVNFLDNRWLVGVSWSVLMVVLPVQNWYGVPLAAVFVFIMCTYLERQMGREGNLPGVTGAHMSFSEYVYSKLDKERLQECTLQVHEGNSILGGWNKVTKTLSLHKNLEQAFLNNGSAEVAEVILYHEIGHIKKGAAWRLLTSVNFCIACAVLLVGYVSLNVSESYRYLVSLALIVVLLHVAAILSNYARYKEELQADLYATKILGVEKVARAYAWLKTFEKIERRFSPFNKYSGHLPMDVRLKAVLRKTKDV